MRNIRCATDSIELQSLQKKDCAVFISSCDAYSDAWKPFFELFFRYWPDCPFQIFLISTGKIFDDKRVTTIPVFPDKGWASNMAHALSKYRFPFMLYLQEDYFLKRKVSSAYILTLLKTIQKENAACLMLYPAPGPDTSYKDYENIGSVRTSTPYRVSLQAGLWNTSIFKRLIVNGESGAEMEHNGSIRSQTFTEPFLSVKRGIFFPYDISASIDYFSTGITKGRWHAGVIHFFAKQGINADLSKREIEPSSRTWRHFLKSLPFFSPLANLLFKVEYKIKILFQ